MTTITILLIISSYLVYLNIIARKEIKKLKNKLHLTEVSLKFFVKLSEDLSNKKVCEEKLPTTNTSNTKKKIVRRTSKAK